jgi:hypothetical protein
MIEQRVGRNQPASGGFDIPLKGPALQELITQPTISLDKDGRQCYDRRERYIGRRYCPRPHSAATHILILPPHLTFSLAVVRVEPMDGG